MKTLSILSLLVLSALVTPSAHAGETTTAQACSDTSCELSMSSVWGVTVKADKKNGAYVVIRETGGGDPAMNGNNLYLTLGTGSDEEKSYDLGIDLAKLKSVAVKPGLIVIRGTRESMNDDGSTTMGSVRYKVTYSVTKDGAVPASVKVTQTK